MTESSGLVTMGVISDEISNFCGKVRKGVELEVMSRIYSYTLIASLLI